MNMKEMTKLSILLYERLFHFLKKFKTKIGKWWIMTFESLTEKVYKINWYAYACLEFLMRFDYHESSSERFECHESSFEKLQQFN